MLRNIDIAILLIGLVGCIVIGFKRLFIYLENKYSNRGMRKW